MNDPNGSAADPYHLFAKFYDLEFAGVVDDLPFYQQFAVEAGGPVLELGCGSGRVLEALLDANVPLSGVDSSPAMLALARDRLKDAVELHLCPMQAIASLEFRHAPFWLAICAINTFLHLPGIEDQLQTLRAARQLVVPGGLLILDVFAPDPTYLAHLDGRITCEFSTTLGDGSQLDKWVARTHDLSEQIIETQVWYELCSPSDGSVRRFADRYAMRYVHRFELEHLLARAGWSIVSLFGSYDLEAYGPDAERMLVLATWHESEA